MMMMMTIFSTGDIMDSKLYKSFTLSNYSEETIKIHLSSNGFMRLATHRESPNKKFKNYANVLIENVSSDGASSTSDVMVIPP